MIATRPRTDAKAPRRFDSLHALIGTDLGQTEICLDRYLQPYRRCFPAIIDHLSAYRGKRLRPALTLLCAHALNLGVRPTHHAVSAIVETIHTATLIHDDVLDDAAVRRSTPTLHSRWGNKASILLGDLLFSVAYREASKTGDAKIGEMIGDATTRVCAGEILQNLHSHSWDVSESAYYEMIDGKTAALTECACRLAGHVSGAPPEITERLASFGRELGLAFQISDDLLDIAGDAGAVGKTLGTDLKQRKATLPIILFLKGASAADRAIFEEHDTDPAVVHDLFRRTGIIEATKKTVDRHVDLAKRHLLCMPLSPFRSALEKIADWCAGREH